MDVDIFIPCFIDQFYPETGMNMVKILRKLNITVHYNSSQTCCGQPSFNSGYWKETLEIAEKFARDFPNNRPIVSPSASCTAFIKNFYPELSKEKQFNENYLRLNRNLFEISDFLVNHLKITHLGAKFQAKVCYHDACSALREYGIRSEPRVLLSNVEGLELIEMPESETCCGFGGTFSAKFTGISSAMAQQKVENALSTGAEYIVSTEASCLMNIAGYISRNNLPIKAIHLVDILATGL